MGRFRRGTLVVALVAAFVLGAAFATAVGDPTGRTKDLVVPSAWADTWGGSHVLEGDDVALAWGDRVGADPTAAEPGLRFDPAVVVAQLEALHTFDVDVLGLGASEGFLADRKMLVVVDGSWSDGPGAPGVGADVVDGGLSAPDGAPPPTRGAVVDGVALLRVAPEVLAASLSPVAASAAGAGPTVSAGATPSPSGDAQAGAAADEPPTVPAGTPWELARGVAETLQHLTRAAHPGHGLTAASAATLLTAGSAYLATVAVPQEHADVSDQVMAPHLAWGSPRHGAAGWLLLQQLAERSSPRLVAELWTGSLDSEHLMGAYARLTASNAPALNRRVAHYAMRTAVGDVAGTGGPGALLADLDPVLVAHRTTPAEQVPDDPGHHRVTGAFAPAAYGYTVVRLAPDGSGADVRVRVRGHAEAAAGAYPGWSFGLVADGPAGPRYSPVTEATDGELRLALREGETDVYLVVTATPARVVPSGLDRFAGTTRYPYEFRVAGASVVEPATHDLDGGHPHPHGGGWVDDTASVDPAAYVAPGAVVRGDATVGPGVRLEGRAWVEAGARLTGDVVVRDAAVVRGTARLSGGVVVGGDAVVGFTCDAGSYTSYRAGATCDPEAVETDVNPVVTPFLAEETALRDEPVTLGATADPAPGVTLGGAPDATPPGTPTPGRTPSEGAGPEPTTTAPPSPGGSQPGVAAPPAAVQAGACTATYVVTSTWPGGVQANITVTATTSGVHGWVVSWTQPAGLEITEQWAAQITRSGSTVTAENLEWNGAIADGGSITFGFNGTAESDDASAVPPVRCSPAP